MTKQTYSIQGMHCGSCALLIERAVKKLPGVTEVTVNYGDEKAHVVSDSVMTPEQSVVEAIEELGYQAHLVV